jgi:hypothetical protein
LSEKITKKFENVDCTLPCAERVAAAYVEKSAAKIQKCLDKKPDDADHAAKCDAKSEKKK